MITLLLVGSLCLHGASANVRRLVEKQPLPPPGGAAPAGAPAGPPSASPAGSPRPPPSDNDSKAPSPGPAPAPSPSPSLPAPSPPAPSPSPPAPGPPNAGSSPPPVPVSQPQAAVAGSQPPPAGQQPVAVAPVANTPPPNEDTGKSPNEVKAEKKKLMRDSEEAISKAAQEASEKSEGQLHDRGGKYVHDISSNTDKDVARSVAHSKDMIREGGSDLSADQADKFKGTLAKQEHDAETRVKDIKEHTADVGGRVVSRAASDATKSTIEEAQKELNAFHQAEHEMSSAANIATMAAQHNVNMWRKAMEFANAGKTFAVDAMKEAKKAQREAGATKEEVTSSLEHAQLNTQATGVAKGNATSARDKAAEAKLLADTVHGQVNKTKAGIEQANIDLDTILKDTKFAADEAKKAFMYTRKIKESVPKKNAAEESAGPPVPDKSSEDANLLQSGRHVYHKSLF